jgi:thymidine kinase
MGTLEVICGPMFSGKTEELIRRVTRAVIARRKVQVFKPRADTRYDRDAVVSHSQWRVESTVVDTAGQILERLDPGAEVVGIDEVQFLGPPALETCRALVERGLRIVQAEDRVVVGAADAYEPRCRKCFSPEPSPATSPPEQELFAFVKRAGSQGT